MSVTTASATTTSATTTSATTTSDASAKSLIVGGLTAAAVAAAATSGVAVAGEAAGVGLDIAGEPIPVAGFALLTAVFSCVGLVLALVLRRWARRPRTAFVRTTIVLTVMSLVPDVLVDAPVSTKLLLMLTHLVAAAIVIPAVARRLPA
ncbi:DUF6069 family protein [Actinomadura sp. WMMA1423]|uniref:DUF6069 family protein n=1 Tax=Actinomadura sp. WMMA1423 TaxID=2591108 RepID=UPI001146AFB8|nr:DUF6069 family protein [Actinomadura sp. WMMA1423]